jgi:hypothetical protein
MARRELTMSTRIPAPVAIALSPLRAPLEEIHEVHRRTYHKYAAPVAIHAHSLAEDDEEAVEEEEETGAVEEDVPAWIAGYSEDHLENLIAACAFPTTGRLIEPFAHAPALRRAYYQHAAYTPRDALPLKLTEEICEDLRVSIARARKTPNLAKSADASEWPLERLHRKHRALLDAAGNERAKAAVEASYDLKVHIMVGGMAVHLLEDLLCEREETNSEYWLRQPLHVSVFLALARFVDDWSLLFARLTNKAREVNDA